VATLDVKETITSDASNFIDLILQAQKKLQELPTPGSAGSSGRVEETIIQLDSRSAFESVYNQAIDQIAKLT